MRLLCPQCHSEIGEIPAVGKKTLCGSCRKQFRCPEVPEPSGALLDLRNPPRGTWFKEFTNGFELGASMRSPMKLLLVPFACCWIAGSAGLFLKSVANPPGYDVWLLAFALALVGGAVYFGGVGVLGIFGKVAIRRHGDAGEVFTGVGAMGFHRRFNWSQVQSMKITPRHGIVSSQQIKLQGVQTLRFGSHLEGRRLKFILDALRQIDRDWRSARDVVTTIPTRRRQIAFFP